VTGYTDNTPIRTRQFASNLELSQERASQILQLLQNAGVDPSRLQALGKGDADPISDNTSTQGRAQNRRVSITVMP
jgi:type VI secretion system protein ImpK